ncbi:hypothetical protein SDC9_178463 [bioreactor metagenome]|uniref:Uncharacterized protein n=1 Tax=bioreactor metagenome TaxID=1076179 RepID=A0A645GY68_9ZZZZ
MLNELFAEHARVISGAAADDGQALIVLRALFVPREALGLEREFLCIDILLKGSAERIRLLADFLDHEMFVVAFFRRLHVPVDVRRRLLNLHAEFIVILNSALAKNGNLTILHEADVPRVFQERRNIGSNDALIVAVTQHHRAVLAGAVDGLRIVRKENGERKRALEHADRLLERFKWITVVEIAQ